MPIVAGHDMTFASITRLSAFTMMARKEGTSNACEHPGTDAGIQHVE